MSRNRQLPTLRHLAFDALAKQGLFRTEFDFPLIQGIPVKEQDGSSRDVELPLEYQQEGVTSLICEMAKERLLPRLLHAVVNDDRKTVREMLDLNPELLLLSPHENCVIENQHTWQKFYAEDALAMAVKLRQRKMTELLLPYFDKCEQTADVIAVRTNAFSTWRPYETVKNGNEDEIVIPNEYEKLAELLIQVFRDEPFPNRYPVLSNGNIDNTILWNVALSDPTEFALSCLLHRLVPKGAVKLDEHMDVELFLLAVYRAYVKHFASFNDDWRKLCAFSIRVPGLIQRALSLETGEDICAGLELVVTAMKTGAAVKYPGHAIEHKLASGESLYCAAGRENREGCGFEFFVSLWARAVRAGVGVARGRAWISFVRQKQQIFADYAARPTSHYAARPAPK